MLSSSASVAAKQQQQQSHVGVITAANNILVPSTYLVRHNTDHCAVWGVLSCSFRTNNSLEEPFITQDDHSIRLFGLFAELTYAFSQESNDI